MNARKQAPAPRPKTLADLYADRDLTPSQVRRIVAVLGLATPRAETAGIRSEAA